MAEKENEFLNERDLHQDVTGSDEEEEEQCANCALVRAAADGEAARAASARMIRRGDDADQDQAEQNRKSAVDLVIGGCARGVHHELPQIARLDRIEEEWTIVGDRAARRTDTNR